MFKQHLKLWKSGFSRLKCRRIILPLPPPPPIEAHRLVTLLQHAKESSHQTFCFSLVEVSTPSFHIKLGVTKNFVKCLDTNGITFSEKIREGVFVGPDIRKLMQNAAFDEMPSPIELDAWKNIKKVIYNVLGKNRSPIARICEDTMLKAFEKLDVQCQQKFIFLNSHMD